MSKIAELAKAVSIGKSKLVPGLVQEAIDEGNAPIDILNQGMIEAMAVVGEKFKAGEIFVPEMLVAAKAMKKGVEALKPHLGGDNTHKIGKMAMGTVYGDLHDIGKNLVASMLEGCGFEVVNIGIDVDSDAFVQAVQTNQADILCMSALLTTTMTYMKEVIAALEAAGLRDKVKVMVGGAPVTQDFADEIGADGYSDNANAAVAVAKQLLGK